MFFFKFCYLCTYMYVCPAHICIDKLHITDEAKLACKCEPQDLPISTSPALGLLVCSTMFFFFFKSGFWGKSQVPKLTQQVIF